jgi:DNA invertase Pin-like site-specific DNA recombinase
VLLSFAQFELEVTSERIRDKIAASEQKGVCLSVYVVKTRQVPTAQQIKKAA